MQINYKKITIVSVFFSLLLTIFIGSCKKDTFEADLGTCPLVISTNPINASTGVPLNQVVSATFNTKINPSTITQESFQLRSNTAVNGSLTFNQSTSTLRFTPTSPLALNTTYIAKITTAVQDIHGNALQTDYIWTFTTGAALTPMVIATDPSNNATGVALNKIISASFNMPMDSVTLNNTSYTLKQGNTLIPGSISHFGSTYYFNPINDLTPNTLYTATITTAAKNTSGTALTTNYTWSFTTGNVLAPIVISTNPSNNQAGVPLNSLVRATFNMPMDPNTINSANFRVRIGNTDIGGTVSYNAMVATFTPSSDLLPGATYTATITVGAENLAGTPLDKEYVWNFGTIDSLGPQSPNLLTVERFGIIAGAGIANNAGFSVINNLDVGIYPGLRSSITGFPPAVIINGALYAADDAAPIPAMLLQAKNDLTAVYLYLEGATTPAPQTVSGDQGGKTLAPGIYKSTSTLLIQNGNLTLDAQGKSNAVWIFQIASDFTTIGSGIFPSPSGGNIILTGGAQAKNVYWQVGSSATIGDFTSFNGNILALTSITMNAYSQAVGRMLCSNGSVVMTSTNVISKP